MFSRMVGLGKGRVFGAIVEVILALVKGSGEWQTGCDW